MSDEIKSKYDQVRKLVNSGSTAKNACEKVGMITSTYYGIQSKKNMRAKKLAKKPKLLVHDIPMIPQAQKTAQAFIVFGNPSALADFARSYL